MYQLRIASLSLLSGTWSRSAAAQTGWYMMIQWNLSNQVTCGLLRQVIVWYRLLYRYTHMLYTLMLDGGCLTEYQLHTQQIPYTIPGYTLKYCMDLNLCSTKLCGLRHFVFSRMLVSQYIILNTCTIMISVLKQYGLTWISWAAWRARARMAQQRRRTAPYLFSVLVPCRVILRARTIPTSCVCPRLVSANHHSDLL